MNTIYAVENKVFLLFFESKEDAEAFCSQHGTVTNGLTVREVQVVAASKKD
jgi:hypothetical protein